MLSQARPKIVTVTTVYVWDLLITAVVIMIINV